MATPSATSMPHSGRLCPVNYARMYIRAGEPEARHLSGNGGQAIQGLRRERRKLACATGAVRSCPRPRRPDEAEAVGTGLSEKATFRMTLDQKIQVWVAIGTWVAGLGTLAAVIVALYLSRRVEKVRLNVYAGLREIILGDGSPFQRHLCIGATNLGERPVIINTVGWAVGKGKKRRFAMQTVSGPYTQQYPIELAHGKSASFMVSFLVTPQWPREFATGFVRDLSDRSLKTLVAQVHTSVGQTVEVHPERDLLEELKKAHLNA